MCKPNTNNLKPLTAKDFYNAFFNSEIKDSQGRCPIRSLMYGESMDIAAKIAFDLYQKATGVFDRDFICLSDRQDEFTEALRRGFDDDLEVYEGWDKDIYFVVNNTKKSEYKVEFKTIDEKALVRCECQDFLRHRRICKHIAQKLVQTMYGFQPIKTKAPVKTEAMAQR